MKRIRGFTIIELTMVISVIGILAVFAFMSLPKTTFTLDAQALQLESDIRYAQSLSMTKGQRYRWSKTSSTSYQVLDSGGTAVILPSGSTTVTLGTGITFGALTNLPNDLVAFDGRGIPYTTTGSPGTALAATALIPLTAGGQTKTVSITPQTGRMIVALLTDSGGGTGNGNGNDNGNDDDNGNGNNGNGNNGNNGNGNGNNGNGNGNNGNGNGNGNNG